VYISIFLPLRMGFSLSTTLGENVLDVMLDLFFLADMVLNFRTGYIDSSTKTVVVSPSAVALKYVKGWFLLDLFSSLPVSMLSLVDETLENAVFIKLLRFLKIFRISRLMRLDFIKELEYKGILAPSFIRMMKFLVIFLFNLHLITCFFWMIFSEGEIDEAKLKSDRNGGWGNIPLSEVASKLSRRYVYGLYWSLVVSLGNDFAPEDMGQRLYSTAILIIGIFLYAIIVGSASSLMTNLDHNAAMKKRQMDDINYYMMFHKVPTHLQNKVRAYYEYQWSQGIGVQEEHILFHKLSKKWQTRLQVAVKAKFIEQVPIFKDLHSKCVEALVLKLKPIITLPSEVIITQGKEGREMFFINRGKVQCVITQTNEATGETSHAKLSQMGAGSYFGEIALLDRRQPIRTVSVVSITYCNFFVLELHDFEQVMRVFPEVAHALSELVSIRRQKSEITHKELQENKHKGAILHKEGEGSPDFKRKKKRSVSAIAAQNASEKG